MMSTTLTGAKPDLEELARRIGCETACIEEDLHFMRHPLGRKTGVAALWPDGTTKAVIMIEQGFPDWGALVDEAIATLREFGPKKHIVPVPVSLSKTRMESNG